MAWLDDIREHHIKAVGVFLLTCSFIHLNWGHTLEGIKHIILLIKTRSHKTLETEHAQEISYTLIHFGETSANLCIHLGIGIAFFKFLNWWNFNSQYQEYDIKAVLKENRRLVEQTHIAQQTLGVLTKEIKQLEPIISLLPNYGSQIAEVGYAIEGVHHKTKRRPAETKENDAEQTPDLFVVSKPKGKRPPRHKRGKLPKF